MQTSITNPALWIFLRRVQFLDCLVGEPEASASSSLTSDEDSTAQLRFLLLLGDYAGRLWKCLRKASVALKDDLPDRVGELQERLIVEDRLGVGPGQPYGNTLGACVNHLREAGLDVTPEMARLAILIYTERNEVCHRKVGNPNIAGNSRALSEAIDEDIETLSQVLPEDQVDNRKILRATDVFLQRQCELAGRRG